ncbi:MAG: hypothetical protein ACKN94_01680 [Pirellulaceae bacterium]
MADSESRWVLHQAQRGLPIPSDSSLCGISNSQSVYGAGVS